MAIIIFPLPARNYDPSEIAVSWSVLTEAGHTVRFATPDGRPAEPDSIMITGRGLDPWSAIPVLGQIRLLGLLLRADARARAAHARMIATPAFQKPLLWDGLRQEDFDGLLLGGGHRARGMRPYLESAILQTLVAAFFEADKPVAAICHGVLLAARSKRADGRSVLYGRKTTALTWSQERIASRFGRFGRFWDRFYYRTYPESAGQPEGFMSVQQEVTRLLAKPEDFLDVPPAGSGSMDAAQYRKKTSGLSRDTPTDPSPAWVVRDGNYVSARWPGDAHRFAAAFSAVLLDGSKQ